MGELTLRGELFFRGKFLNPLSGWAVFSIRGGLPGFVGLGSFGARGFKRGNFGRYYGFLGGTPSLWSAVMPTGG